MQYQMPMPFSGDDQADTMLATQERRRRGIQRTEAARAAGRVVIKRRADEAVRVVGPVVVNLRNEGRSLAEIAAFLDRANLKTPRGTTYHPESIRRVLTRTAALSARA